MDRTFLNVLASLTVVTGGKLNLLKYKQAANLQCFQVFFLDLNQHYILILPMWFYKSDSNFF